jgi:hypothetical protein
VQVRLEDQKCINEFGRLNSRKTEAKEDLAEAKKRLQELEDADEAVLLADEAVPGAIKCVPRRQPWEADMAAGRAAF